MRIPGASWVLLLSLTATAQEIPYEKFDKLHHLVRPQKGEIAWEEIPWETSVWEARQKAAKLGKPLFLWRANDGHVLGMT